MPDPAQRYYCTRPTPAPPRDRARQLRRPAPRAPLPLSLSCITERKKTHAVTLHAARCFTYTRQASSPAPLARFGRHHPPLCPGVHSALHACCPLAREHTITMCQARRFINVCTRGRRRSAGEAPQRLPGLPGARTSPQHSMPSARLLSPGTGGSAPLFPHFSPYLSQRSPSVSPQRSHTVIRAPTQPAAKYTTLA